VRWLVFGLAILGALMAAVASQILETDRAHAILTALGAVILAAGTFISARLLRDSDVEAWVRRVLAQAQGFYNYPALIRRAREQASENPQGGMATKRSR
jgi:drug/metabolite transporter (DMT)-like permease